MKEKKKLRKSQEVLQPVKKKNENYNKLLNQLLKNNNNYVISISQLNELPPPDLFQLIEEISQFVILNPEKNVTKIKKPL